MKRISSLIMITLIMIVAFSGCPYESKVPLSDPQKSVIDHLLTGRWINIMTSAGRSDDTLLIMRFNDHEYYLESRGIKNGKIVIERGRGFTTLIGDRKILNVCDLNEPGKYYLSRYEIKNDLMIISSMSDKFTKETFPSSREFYAFFRKNMDETGFFEDADTLRKIK